MFRLVVNDGLQQYRTSIARHILVWIIFSWIFFWGYLHCTNRLHKYGSSAFSTRPKYRQKVFIPTKGNCKRKSAMEMQTNLLKQSLTVENIKSPPRISSDSTRKQPSQQRMWQNSQSLSTRWRRRPPAIHWSNGRWRRWMTWANWSTNIWCCRKSVWRVSDSVPFRSNSINKFSIDCSAQLWWW